MQPQQPETDPWMWLVEQDRASTWCLQVVATTDHMTTLAEKGCCEFYMRCTVRKHDDVTSVHLAHVEVISDDDRMVV